MNIPGPRAFALTFGERYYMSDVPCPQGHIGKRFTKTYECYECRLAQRALQAKRHRELHGNPLRSKEADTIYKHTRRYLLQPTYRTRRSALLGCTGATLRQLIEAAWKPGMGWDNYGNGPDHWNIDHKQALSSFDLTDPVQYAAAAHHTNLQPLWRRENLVKRI